MAISFDKALGIHDDALLVRGQRAEVLANNIANADTPNFLARDLDFKSVLEGEANALKQAPLKMMVTDHQHQEGVIDPAFAAEMMYRIPNQAAVDGNTVEVQEEMARYTENALGYQTSFTFLNKKFQGMERAIKGE
ncbi:MAG: flagellar basal body rod protein FlgB [Pontibacterium sp.]